MRRHFDSTVHAAACLHTGIATNHVLELRTRHTILNLINGNKEYDDVIESVEIAFISAMYEWRELVFCPVMCKYGFRWEFPIENHEQNAGERSNFQIYILSVFSAFKLIGIGIGSGRSINHIIGNRQFRTMK